MRGRGIAFAVLVAVLMLEARALASTHTVQIREPEEGDRVGGLVTIEAVTEGTVVSVEFSWRRASGATWTTIGAGVPDGDVWTALWDTGNLNGAAVLRAAASDGFTLSEDLIDIVLDNVAPDVTVSATPEPFSPNGDGRKDHTRLVVETGEPTEVVLEVLDGDGQVRRRWRGTADDEFSVQWNGKANRRTLPDGRYRVRATATDAAGLEGSDSEALVIDTKAPRARLLSVSPEPLREQDEMRFRFRAQDRPGRLSVRLLVEDRGGAVARERDHASPGRRTIAWRPRYGAGGKLFPGQYESSLVVTDQAGNRDRTRALPWRVLREAPAGVFRRLTGAGRRVALTFDDCHFDGAWASILNTLDARHVDATFFCPGQQMASAPALVRRTDREGHVIAAHGWDHADLTGVGYDGTRSRLSRDEETAWRIARQTTAPYFRPPYGAYNAAVVSGARAASHPRVIMWDIDTLDWTGRSPGEIASAAVGPARSGSIILMHTLNQTASALPSILSGLRRKGLRPVTIAELFEAAGYRPG